ncbi:adenine phosphoribosyltransferase [Synoicihabitans lomoniglobus]|uniref:Adenine phosphoribosyltransferase n=1 Tax=Synoicihabitans lomoniglobus TaxID=2909285 RepID=A0AAE9ZWR7_9BACT|nr:adenine phosphoribosyltransferase [Opitutaceae bacterium LMO-M01]WED64300.1 adenine phosphoribosyltransferase [Opitutaceae bacterium LMO-M01]
MDTTRLANFLKARIRTVPDWPIAGVNFRDVTTLFNDPEAFRVMIEAFSLDCTQLGVDVIAAIDARGFIIGGALSYQLHKPFVLVRKKGKLPYTTHTEDYALEYGTASIQINTDACAPGQRVLLVDDLIATGGTLLAAAKLFAKVEAEVVGVAAIIDLPELGGSAKLREAGLPVHSLCSFSESE